MAEHSAAAVAVAELRVDHRLMLRLGPGAGVTWEDIHHRSYQFKMVHIYLYIYIHIYRYILYVYIYRDMCVYIYICMGSSQMTLHVHDQGF